jgi:hypothetical protein
VDRQDLDAAMEIVCSGRNDYISKKYRLAGMVFRKKVGRKISGKIDPMAIELFGEAKRQGLTTGIYSRSSVDIINPYLEYLGIRGLFDHVVANEIAFDNNSKIVGLDEKVKPGKVDICDHMEEISIDPRRMAFVDDADKTPLDKVGYGYVAPGAKEEFKKECSESGIPILKNWKSLGIDMGFW